MDKRWNLQKTVHYSSSNSGTPVVCFDHDSVIKIQGAPTMGEYTQSNW